MIHAELTPEEQACKEARWREYEALYERYAVWRKHLLEGGEENGRTPKALETLIQGFLDEIREWSTHAGKVDVVQYMGHVKNLLAHMARFGEYLAKHTDLSLEELKHCDCLRITDTDLAKLLGRM